MDSSSFCGPCTLDVLFITLPVFEMNKNVGGDVTTFTISFTSSCLELQTIQGQISGTVGSNNNNNNKSNLYNAIKHLYYPYSTMHSDTGYESALYVQS